MWLVKTNHVLLVLDHEVTIRKSSNPPCTVSYRYGIHVGSERLTKLGDAETFSVATRRTNRILNLHHNVKI